MFNPDSATGLLQVADGFTSADLAFSSDGTPGDSGNLQKLVDDQLAKGLVVESKPNIKRAISPMPVVKPIRVTGPNSVFELGTVFAKS